MTPPQNENSRDKIEASAQATADHAGPRVNAALEYVEKYTELPFHAFGVLPGVLVSGTYNEARTSQHQNLKDGKEKLRQLVEGMAQVAYTYWNVEAVSSLDSNGREKIETQKPESGQKLAGSIIDGTGATAAAITIVGTVVLRPHWAFCLATKNASARLCPLAVLSIVVWALLEPDEESVGTAKGAWAAAAEQLKNIGELETVMSLSSEAWGMDNPSRAQFNTWLASFQVELTDAKDAAAAQIVAIDGVIAAIRGIQIGMLVTDIACLVAMIAFKIMELFPLTKIVGIIGQLGVSITNAIATKVVAAAVIGWIGSWAANSHTIANAAKFKKMSVEPGGKESTFIDLGNPFDDKGWAAT